MMGFVLKKENETKRSSPKCYNLIFRLAVILCVAFLPGCGMEQEDILQSGSDSQAYTDIKTDRQSVTVPAETDENWELLSMQFYEDEIVQFWGKLKMDGRTFLSMDVYLFRGEGNGELLLEEATRQYRNTWFLDGEENCYVLNSGIARLDEKGKEIWHWKDGLVRDICQLPDGKIMLIVKIGEKMKLAELNPETGEVTEKNKVELDGKDTGQYIGAGENGLVILNEEGFWEVDAETGIRLCVMPFEGSSYRFEDSIGKVSDFRAVTGGRVEVIRGREMETLQMADIRGERTAITVRNNFFDFWEKYWTEEFNRKNETYYVVLEECSDSGLLAQTGVEIATGGGPDILGGYVIVYELTGVSGLIEKGVLEELTPYMERAGIRKDDYFPAAFSCWQDGERVYAVDTHLNISGSAGYWISEELLGGDDEPDIEALVNALYNYPEERVVYCMLGDSQWILSNVFFKGTEDLWGMVDWEKGTCDFGGELFVKMLEMARKYGYSDEKRDYPVLSDWRTGSNCYNWMSLAQLEEEGKRYVGYFTDDGCHTLVVPNKVMTINSNSTNKEGAWEYICFLLGKEAQEDFKYRNAGGHEVNGYPVSRNAFEEVMKAEMEEGAIGRIVGITGNMVDDYKAGQMEFIELKRNAEAYRKLYDLREETVQEIKETLEDARHMPVKTEPVLNIIFEEAADYFNGTKSVEEVVKVIENRVGLYLKEQG